MQDKVELEVHNSGRQEETVQGSTIQGSTVQQSQRIDPTRIESNSRFKATNQRANPLSRLFFVYAIKMAFKGRFRKNPLDEPDMITIPWKHRPDVISNRILYYLEQQKRKNPNKKASLAKATLQATKWVILKVLLIELIFVSVRIFSTYVLYKLVSNFIAQDSGQAFGWACVLTGCLVLGFFTEHHWNYPGQYYPTLVQNALVDLLYGKITRLSSYAMTQINSGKLLNLATNDLNFLDHFGMFFPSIIVGIYSVIIGSVVVWQFFGVFTLIGMGYVVIWWPIQVVAIASSTKSRNVTTDLTNKRVKTTTETIEGVRLLKMYTWEMKFKEKIESIRKRELKLLKNSAIGQAISRGMAFTIQNCSSFLTFLAWIYTGHSLDVAGTFATYFVFGYLRIFSSYFVSSSLIFIGEARVVLRTLGKVMEAPEIGDVKFENPKNPENSVEFENFTACWQTDDPNKAPEDITSKQEGEGAKLVQHDLKPTLIDINLELKKGSINALVGTVGASKTSFLMAFTGEMPKTTGSLRYKGSIAYVEQEPTIFAGTFRDNVIFGKPFDEKRYEEAVRVCNLHSDLKLFPKGDQADIVGGGNNLSGGQKARLAFARAVYANADIYLLDDPLSAVDPKVARSLYKNAIEGALKGKTVILVTHQVDYVKNCENIIVIEKGRVLGSGTLQELKDKGVNPEKIFGAAIDRDKQAQLEYELHLERGISIAEPELLRGQTSTKRPLQPQEVKERKIPKDTQDLNKEEEDTELIQRKKFTGRVGLKTYGGLIHEMGGIPAALLILVVITATQMSNIAFGRLLGAWIGGTFATWKTTAILGGLTGFNIFIYVMLFLVLSLTTFRAARRYHEKILNNTITGKVLFFDTNSVGEVSTRFSSDIGTMDRFIPLGLTDTLNILSFLITIVITVGIVKPLLLAPLLGAMAFAGVMLVCCYPSIQQTKMYEHRYKGQAFGLFAETLNGSVIMHIYGQADNFKKRFRESLHKAMKGNFSFVLAGRIAGFYSDMGYNIAAIGCLFILTASSTEGDTQAYLSAFSLSLILGITGLLQHGLRQFSTLNISMASVQRLEEYCHIPQEPALELPSDAELSKKGWPSQGEIEMHKVYMKYRPDAEFVIKDLELDVKPGEKIGCVGRTGAGKSSVVQLLYRMREIDRKEKGSCDSYVKIDDVNTQSVGLHLLRQNISMIPQVPYIFSETIRSNIDPLNKYTDEEIWSVLEDVSLKEHIENQPGKLDAKISSGSAIFSVGQKQLVCLARVVLKPASILIMDEATANMDHATDNFLQEKINQRFAKSTRITVAHRLTTIADYDKVLVLSKGRKVEFDEPYRLLVKNIGDMELTNPEGFFSIMVQNTGPISSKQIFEIAKTAYFDKHKEELEQAGLIRITSKKKTE